MESIIEKKESTLSILEHHYLMYTNPNRVSFYLDSQGLVTMYGAYPNFDPEESYTSLTYRQEYPSIELFEKSLSIGNREQLDSIDSKFLENLFDKGNIDLVCYFELNGRGLTLVYRKQDSVLFAHEIESSNVYQIKRNKNSAVNYVDFTKELAIFRNNLSKYKCVF
jgi:hypothetical protein